jgi:proline dehydrogenase
MEVAMIWLNNLIAGLLPWVPRSLVGIFARQYIAGETLSDAVTKIRELNNRQIEATVDLLGEDPKSRSDCLKAVETYKNAIRQIRDHRLLCGISLKPSQMGINIDSAFCFDNITTLVRNAEENNIFVRIDMEDVSLKAGTIDLFLKLKTDYDNVGIVMQAYMRSGIEDVNRMIGHNANIRLCKGAYYWEDETTVYKDMAVINSSYVYLLEKLLKAHCFTAIATHDEKIVFEAFKIIDRLGLSKEQYEFQMLYGVSESLRQRILERGHKMRVYVPFGKDWFAYSVRRLKENPRMVSYIIENGLKNIFKK